MFVPASALRRIEANGRDELLTECGLALSDSAEL
jgi:hypothetical protein